MFHSAHGVSTNMVGKMNKDDIATSYHINITACREANDMLTKENEELRAKIKRLKSKLLSAIRALKDSK